MNDWETYYADYINANGYDLRLQPFYLLYNGYVSSGALGGTGLEGSYWSLVAYDSSTAYRLLLFSSTVAPSVGGTCYTGFPIRCLAR